MIDIYICIYIICYLISSWSSKLTNGGRYISRNIVLDGWLITVYIMRGILHDSLTREFLLVSSSMLKINGFVYLFNSNVLTWQQSKKKSCRISRITKYKVHFKTRKVMCVCVFNELLFKNLTNYWTCRFNKITHRCTEIKCSQKRRCCNWKNTCICTARRLQ